MVVVLCDAKSVIDDVVCRDELSRRRVCAFRQPDVVGLAFRARKLCQVLHREVARHILLVDDARRRLVLLYAKDIDALFESEVCDKAVDKDLLVLPHAIAARDGLVVVDRVPGDVRKDDPVGPGQVEADATRLGSHVHDVAVARWKVGEDLVASLDVHVSSVHVTAAQLLQVFEQIVARGEDDDVVV